MCGECGEELPDVWRDAQPEERTAEEEEEYEVPAPFSASPARSRVAADAYSSPQLNTTRAPVSPGTPSPVVRSATVPLPSPSSQESVSSIRAGIGSALSSLRKTNSAVVSPVAAAAATAASLPSSPSLGSAKLPLSPPVSSAASRLASLGYVFLSIRHRVHFCASGVPILQFVSAIYMYTVGDCGRRMWIVLRQTKWKLLHANRKLLPTWC